MKKLLLLPLLFFPVIVAFLFEYNYCSFDMSRYENLGEGILFGVLLFGLVSLLKIGRFRTILFIITYVLFAISIWLESSFFYLYEVNFNPSTIFILLETSFSETREFLSSYADTTLVVFTLIMFASLFFVVPFVVGQIRFFSWFINPPSIVNRMIIGVFGGMLIVGTLKFTGIIVQNLPYLFVKTSIQYAQQTTAYDDLGLTDKIGKFSNSIRKSRPSNETFVIVIGESHTRHKMSLYDYDRPTNPKLEAIKDELVIFDDVISPYTYTIRSLEKALTLGNQEDSTAVTKGSLIQLFNSVGFKTFWLSNQRPVGIDENLLTKISSAADESVFINIADYNMTTTYDGELLEPFQKILEDEYPKKVVFVHLLGNHIEYSKRYPEEFQVFKTIDDKYQNIEDIIDAYDNATVYNDYILDDMIKRLNDQDDESFMLYFSDHGEEVYQTQDTYGHFEGDASKPMYDIPFVLWQSEKFKKARPIRYRTYREYMIDDLIHSIAHLANIKFEGYDARRSLFSIYFKNRTRIIQQDVDYNKLYK